MTDRTAARQDLAADLARIEVAFRSARAHPLSSRKARLVAVLLDNYCDQAFEVLRAVGPAPVFFAEDVLTFRHRLRGTIPALGLIFDLCAGARDGPRLETQDVAVPIEDYGTLTIEDFMVSLYNSATVQRVVIVAPDGTMRLVHDVMGEAITGLENIWRLVSQRPSRM